VSEVKRIRPIQSQRYVANPHRGCCTYNGFNGDPLGSADEPMDFQSSPSAVSRGFVHTTVASCRWFWSTLAPTSGHYDFGAVDRALESCKRTGQTLAVRIMPYGPSNLPQSILPQWFMEKHGSSRKKALGGEFPAPDVDSAVYFEHFGGLIAEFGRRYGDNPLIESVDLSYVGALGASDAECSQKQTDKFLQLYFKAFRHTPLLATLDGHGAGQAIEMGAGWRVDAFGDLRCSGTANVTNVSNWNHHFDVYPRLLNQLNCQDVWKRRPVYLQTFSIPQTWQDDDFDIDFILEQGLKFHATIVDPKYNALPADPLPRLRSFFDKLGYRFVLRQCIVESEAEAGKSTDVQMWIDNTGVAPIYRDYALALRFQQGVRNETILLNSSKPQDWLPGDHWISERVKVPPGFKSGSAHLSVGIVERQTLQPAVSFAVREMYADRWVPCGVIEIS
jgi:hypothetical protein